MVDASAMKKAFTVSDIKPLDQYDFNRAKICASVRWLLSKSYGSAGRRYGAVAGGSPCDADALHGWGAGMRGSIGLGRR